MVMMRNMVIMVSVSLPHQEFGDLRTVVTTHKLKPVHKAVANDVPRYHTSFHGTEARHLAQFRLLGPEMFDGTERRVTSF